MIATPVWFDDAVQPIATALLTAWPATGWLDFNRMPWLPLLLDDLAGPTWAEIERRQARRRPNAPAPAVGAADRGVRTVRIEGQ